MNIRNLIKAIIFVSALSNLSPSLKATQFLTNDTRITSQSKSVNWVNKVFPKHINGSLNRLFQKYKNKYKNNYKSNSKDRALQTYRVQSPLLYANARNIKNEL